jgi:hypothetical protein
MITNIPYINPIRFQKTDVIIDNVNIFPWSDNMRLGINYQRGIDSVNYICDFVVNNEISFITVNKLTTGSLSENARLLDENGTFVKNIARTNIAKLSIDSTPVWITKHFTTLDTEGIFYIDYQNIITGEVWVSDLINVHSNEKKGLLKINYFDTQNRYGGYFFKSTTEQVWNPTMYVTGQVTVGAPETESSVYDDELGNVIPLSQQPKRIRNLKILDVSELYADTIFQWTMCNNLYINGQRFYASDYDTDQLDKSDLIEVSAKLTLRDNEYYYKFE